MTGVGVALVLATLLVARPAFAQDPDSTTAADSPGADRPDSTDVRRRQALGVSAGLPQIGDETERSSARR